jgi:hypothetical protein
MACKVNIAFVQSDGRKTWTTKRNCRPSVETHVDAKNWAVDEARRMSTSQSGLTSILLTAENEKASWRAVTCYVESGPVAFDNRTAKQRLAAGRIVTWMTGASPTASPATAIVGIKGL